MSRLRTQAGLLACTVALAGCASLETTPPDRTTLFERIQTRESGGLTVSIAVPTLAETRQIFGVPLEAEGVQPVWLRISNQTAEPYHFVPAALDPEYFSPQEVAWSFRKRFSKSSQAALQAWFDQQSISRRLRPGTTIEGFLHTQRDYGVKFVNVELHRVGGHQRFEFVVEEPGFRADYRRADFQRLLGTDAGISITRDQLREVLATMPCCVLGPDLETPGDPLNLVVVGPKERPFFSFARRGWDVTETIGGMSTWRTILSSVFGTHYRTSPVSPLYYDGRPQDIALQKTRGSVDERNHLRLWLTPYRVGGLAVWIGQTSRDIGVRMSSRTFVTHKIDPDVDETRDYLLHDLLLSGGLRAFGYVTGVGPATQDAPRFNYTLDPYYTDGLRVVLVLGGDVADDSSPELLNWHWPEPDDPGTLRIEPE